MTSLDVETIEHFDFDFEPPCEAIDPSPIHQAHLCQGSNPAVWRVKIICCQVIRVYCDKCLEYKLTPMPFMWCPAHDIIFDPPRTAYEFIERIK